MPSYAHHPVGPTLSALKMMTFCCAIAMPAASAHSEKEGALFV